MPDSWNPFRASEATYEERKIAWEKEHDEESDESIGGRSDGAAGRNTPRPVATDMNVLIREAREGYT